MNSNELRDYYIAYFDILGYKSFFDDKENDVFEFLDNVINVCNETLHKTGFNEQALQTQFKVKSFSDNFIIMLEANENSSDYMVLKMYNGCIINTAQQVTSQPNRISICVNKNNFTHDMIV